MTAPKGFTKSFDFGDGREISLETGRLAKQADGSVIVRMGKTMLLATVVSAHEPKLGFDFFPLTVDYQEKYPAAGKIPGGFFKREGRLGEHEILVCRLIDRAIRPLFADGYKNETQVLVSVISLDKENAPDALAALAASTALTLSDIPFNGPIAEVRVCRVDGNYVVNPTNEQMENSDLEIILAANEKDIMMVEGEMAEAQEQDLVDAIKVGHEAVKKMCAAQNELADMAGRKETRKFDVVEDDEALMKQVSDFAQARILEVAESAAAKHDRSEAFKVIKTELKDSFSEEELEEKGELISTYFKNLEKQVIRDMIIRWP